MLELLPEAADLGVPRPSKVTDAVAAVDAFLVQLMTSPLAQWHACAMTMDLTDLSVATGALAVAIETPDIVFAAWLVRDHVVTACHRFESPEGRHICRRRQLCDVRNATERAALALLVHSALCDEHYAALCGGFSKALVSQVVRRE